MSWSFPYRESRDGFFGQKTSTLNFCEDDYAMSYWCAEVCNTVSNAVFLWLGYRGIRACFRDSHPAIFLIAYAGYTIVGVGSTLFHATLKYPMQLVDELSMIYTTCIMCFATFAYGCSRPTALLLGLSLTGLAGYITSHYYSTQDPQFHQDAYAMLTVVVVFSNIWIMEYRVRPALERRLDHKPGKKTGPSSKSIMRELWLMVAGGLTSFLGSFLIWNLDNIYCGRLHQWRQVVQLPWGILSEGHAFWHLGTGIGAHYYITWRIWIHRCLDGDEDKFRLRWPSWFSVPEVIPLEPNTDGNVEKKNM